MTYEQEMEMRNYDVAKALSSLVPGSQWIVEGNTYEGIDWRSDPELKPTKEQVDAEVARLKTNWENTAYQRNRAKEYPDFKLYLDGVVKGDQEQIQAYIDACLAVKEKYPKPAE